MIVPGIPRDSLFNRDWAVGMSQFGELGLIVARLMPPHRISMPNRLKSGEF